MFVIFGFNVDFVVGFYSVCVNVFVVNKDSGVGSGIFV